MIEVSQRSKGANSLPFSPNERAFDDPGVECHADGRFEHRMPINVWQGQGVGQPRAGTAGLQ